MRKRKVTSTVLAVVIGVSTFLFGASSPVQQADANMTESNLQTTYQGTPIDLGIANDERLIEMLKKDGKIAKDATIGEAEKALRDYLKKRGNTTKDKTLTKSDKEKAAKLKQQLKENGVTSGSGNKLGQAKKNEVDSLQEENWNGEVRTDKVLAILIEFPHFPATNIKPSDTDMYYKEYQKEHYEQMLFGDNGYTGPNGEDLLSVKQFYEQQSGGSYSIEGEVAGWYEASKPAAAYGANNSSDNDTDARGLVLEALEEVAADQDVNLAEYDQEDRYDLDGDGNKREPDGMIDHLMIVHSSVGEEAGGGALGADAIWSHRWSLAEITTLPDTSAEVDYWGGKLAAFDYTIEPADGAAGVFAHEYGHDLGLPDEYDTIYSGSGEAVAYWSIMASGSWAGKVPGTEPTGFSAWSKEFLQSSMPESNWLSGSTVHANDITSKGTSVLLDEASSKGTNNDAVRVNLPDKVTVTNTPADGEFEYYGGNGDEIDHSMKSTVIDLRNKTSATLEYDIWYNIEENWDYGMVQISEDGGSTWESLDTPYTSEGIVEEGYPDIIENLPGYTGTSNGWIHEVIDLSSYAGEKIHIQFRYMTDWATSLDGMYVDNIKVTSDGTEVLTDGAESQSGAFTLDGFAVDTGSSTFEHYYLLEWRSHNGVDEGLAHIRRGSSLMSYDAGLLVWYVDESYDNNWTGVHPGDGFLGVVDAEQHTNYWSDGLAGSTRYQVHDAAFSLNKSEKMYLDYSDLIGITMKDNHTKRTPLFDDRFDYSNKDMTDAGRNVPGYGLKFRVVGQSDDGTAGKVLIYK
ncbi:immune inhibitor A domain-containing protein [Thalassobacillus pellis]|uniref:immune inhibitor A domain-containing protein n=1 Tax=Thalassobacillus pellis TaxID=748008 RepID=UPI001961E236|nr:immune inhibitor A domain-containing protein [Thalassobacillus pellis]MBM7552033.1 immune inhibitor A [Thalassobacillus pellis]